MHIHTGQTGSGLVSLAKIGVLPGLVFSVLGLFSGLPEPLYTGETSTTRATTGSQSTGNSGQNRSPSTLRKRLVRKALFFTKELNRLIHQIGKHTKRAWLMP